MPFIEFVNTGYCLLNVFIFHSENEVIVIDAQSPPVSPAQPLTNTNTRQHIELSTSTRLFQRGRTPPSQPNRIQPSQPNRIQPSHAQPSDPSPSHIQPYEPSGSQSSNSLPPVSFIEEGPCTSAIPRQEDGTLENLLGVFSGKVRPEKVIAVYRLSGDYFESALQCLLSGPSLEALLKLHKKQFEDRPPCKLYAESDSLWADGVAYYKMPDVKLDRPIRVTCQQLIPVASVDKFSLTFSSNVQTTNTSASLMVLPIFYDQL